MTNGSTGPEMPSDVTLFRIDWNRHSRAQQQAFVDICARPTLPQSPVYAAALEQVGHAHTEFGLLRFHGRPVGYVYVEKRPFIRWISSNRIYRGPVWLERELPGTIQREFFRLIHRRYRLRHGRHLTFHPELSDTPDNRSQVAACGYRRIADGYATIWLDLSRPPEALRAGLHQKWRNQLRQSERNGLELQIDRSGKALGWLVERHEAHMAAQRYRGPSRGLLEAMTARDTSCSAMHILRAFRNNEPIAGILVVRHGRAATYFVGWNGPEGRQLRANHFLLWQAIRHLQAEGVEWFDLGGVNDADAAPVARFKEGISRERTTLVGGYT